MPLISQLFKTIRHYGHYWAGPAPLFWVMPWFMILLVISTVQQKDIGLYDSIETYLYEPILWWNAVPLPGGGIALGLIYFSLLLKFLFFSPWSLKRSGIILSHFGVLVLMSGGIYTAIYQKEGYMILEEGQSQSFFNDYHQRILKITEDGKTKTTYIFDDLKKSQSIAIENTPIRFSILDKCDNCDVITPSDNEENRRGLAENMALTAKASAINKEENFSGLTIDVAIDNNLEDSGTYILLEDFPQHLTFGNIELIITRVEQALPFSIQLTDFKKIDYPGTNKASDFQSEFTVNDNDITWPASIQMNQPYRYKGFTIYQSSFDEIEGKEISVFNIVDNKGRFFPYISSLIILIGLGLHLSIRIYTKRGKVSVT